MERIKIETTQNVNIHYEIASVGDRIIANIIDAVVMYGYLIGMILIMVGIVDNIHADSDTLVIIGFIIIGIPFMFYHLVSEILLNGQTIGKRQKNIKVIRLDGRQPNMGHYLLRWLLRPIDSFFYGVVGIIAIGQSGKGQRLGDMAAGTCVVKVKNKVNLQESLVIPEIEDEVYSVTYPQVLSLSEKDVATIRYALQLNQKNGNTEVMNRLCERAKETLGLREIHQTPTDFLKTLLKDYTYLADKED